MTQYNFTVDYGLTIQNGNIVATTANNPGGINFVGNSSGDGNGYTTMQLVPDDTVSSQALVLDPTAPGHIHLRAPGIGGNIEQPTANIFLGPENTNFEITAQYSNAAEARIHSAGNTWVFNNNGDITLPNGNPVIQTPDQTGTITIEVRGDATERSELQIGSDGGTDQYVYISSINGVGNRVSLDMGAYANTPAYAKIQTYDGVSVQNEWLFTTAPLDPNEAFLYVPGGASISTPNATGNTTGKNIFIVAGSADQSDFYTTAGGELILKGGRGAFNDGGGGGPGGAVNINAGESADPAGVAGNVYVTAGPTQVWTFDNTGGLNLPGGTGVIESTANNVSVYSDADQLNGVVLYDTGVEVYSLSDVYIYGDNGNVTWTFDNTGTLLAPGAISATGNVTASYLIGDGSQLTNLPASAPVVDSITTGANIIPVATNTQFNVTALAESATVDAPTGSPTDGAKLAIRIRDNGSAQTLTWNVIYQEIGTTLPTTTVANKYVYIGCIYNSQASTWDVVSVAQQA